MASRDVFSLVPSLHHGPVYSIATLRALIIPYDSSIFMRVFSRRETLLAQTGRVLDPNAAAAPNAPPPPPHGRRRRVLTHHMDRRALERRRAKRGGLVVLGLCLSGTCWYTGGVDAGATAVGTITTVAVAAAAVGSLVVARAAAKMERNLTQNNSNSSCAKAFALIIFFPIFVRRFPCLMSFVSAYSVVSS